MRPYVGARLIYRTPSGEDLAATCTALASDGSIALTVFPPMRAPEFAVGRGWSHCGSDAENPRPGTWRWRTFHDEVGPHGRAFIVEIMARAADWQKVLTTFDNMSDYREAYRQQRAAALDRDWPELPPEAPPADPAIGAHIHLDTPPPPASSNGNTPKTSGSGREH
jgi:hypothetical protein